MELDEFLRRRREEVEWLTANGFDNGDPDTNGAYRTVEHLAPFCDVFVDVGANVGQFCDRILAAGPDLHILAFEPDPELLPALHAKLEGGRDGVSGRALGHARHGIVPDPST